MAIILPIVFVIFTWWFSTGIVLWLATRRDGTRRSRLIAMAAIGALGLAGVWLSAQPESAWLWAGQPGDGLAYFSVSSALAVWALIEYTFITGVLTGPRVRQCPPGVSDKERFRLAYQAMSHHEYALFGALIVIGLLTLPSGSAAAFVTFLVLWLMRLSAKFTLFSGAPSFALDMMPRQIAHLRSYIREDRIGGFFWVSIVLTSAAFVGGIAALALGLIPAQEKTAAIMVVTLLGLGVLEHWFMILPIADSALWRWALPPARQPADTGTQSPHKSANLLAANKI